MVSVRGHRKEGTTDRVLGEGREVKSHRIRWLWRCQRLLLYNDIGKCVSGRLIWDKQWMTLFRNMCLIFINGGNNECSSSYCCFCEVVGCPAKYI